MLVLSCAGPFMVQTVQISRPIIFEPTDSVTRASGLHPGGCGFDPRPSHTKDFQMVLAALSFALGDLSGRQYS